MVYETLYHLDNNDNLRVWFMERNGSEYRTHSGIKGGKIVESGWKQAIPTNVGRSNERDATAQAEFEIQALYQKKLDRKYNTDPANAVKSNYVQPMLAATYDEKKTLKKAKRWFYQPKFDGIRCTIDEKGGTSRSGKPFFTVRHIVETLHEIVTEYNVTFDGELYNHDYREDFEKLVSLIKKQKLSSLSEEELQEIEDKVQLHVYDVIMWDSPEATYEERIAFLNGLFSVRLANNSVVKLCPSEAVDDPSHEEISSKHDEYFLNGYEGLMLRDASAPYEFKRSKGLVKFKNFDEAEFELLNIVEGAGNWAGAAKSVIVAMEDGGTSDAGVAGTFERNAYILAHAKEYIGGDVTVKYQGFTKDNKLRFGVVKSFHKGKRDY